MEYSPSAIKPKEHLQSKHEKLGSEAKKEEEVVNKISGRLNEKEDNKSLHENKTSAIPLIKQTNPGKSKPCYPNTPSKETVLKSSSQEALKLNQMIQAQNQDILRLQQRVEKLSTENLQLKHNFSGKRMGSSEKTSKGEASEQMFSLERTIEDLTKQKMSLEDSLRGEMLVSEEQRKYIDVLKEAIETKIDDLGLKDILMKEKGKEELCDIFAQFVLMKNELDTKRREAGLSEVFII